MKILIISESNSVLDSCNDFFTKNGFDTICYSWLLKALDNITEIKPDVVVINSVDYPRHWKTLVQYARSVQGSIKTVFLIVPNEIDTDEKKKMEALKVFYIQEDFVNTDVGLEVLEILSGDGSENFETTLSDEEFSVLDTLERTQHSVEENSGSIEAIDDSINLTKQSTDIFEVEADDISEEASITLEETTEDSFPIRKFSIDDIEEEMSKSTSAMILEDSDADIELDFSDTLEEIQGNNEENDFEDSSNIEEDDIHAINEANDIEFDAVFENLSQEDTLEMNELPNVPDITETDNVSMKKTNENEESDIDIDFDDDFDSFSQEDTLDETFNSFNTNQSESLPSIFEEESDIEIDFDDNVENYNNTDELDTSTAEVFSLNNTEVNNEEISSESYENNITPSMSINNEVSNDFKTDNSNYAIENFDNDNEQLLQITDSDLDEVEIGLTDDTTVYEDFDYNKELENEIESQAIESPLLDSPINNEIAFNTENVQERTEDSFYDDISEECDDSSYEDDINVNSTEEDVIVYEDIEENAVEIIEEDSLVNEIEVPVIHEESVIDEYTEEDPIEIIEDESSNNNNVVSVMHEDTIIDEKIDENVSEIIGESIDFNTNTYEIEDSNEAEVIQESLQDEHTYENVVAENPNVIEESKETLYFEETAEEEDIFQDESIFNDEPLSPNYSSALSCPVAESITVFGEVLSYEHPIIMFKPESEADMQYFTFGKKILSCTLTDDGYPTTINVQVQGLEDHSVELCVVR